MKMNVIVRSLLIGGACVASVACGSKKSAEVAEQPAEVVKPKVTTEVVNVQLFDGLHQDAYLDGQEEGKDGYKEPEGGLHGTNAYARHGRLDG